MRARIVSNLPDSSRGVSAIGEPRLDGLQDGFRFHFAQFPVPRFEFYDTPLQCPRPDRDAQGKADQFRIVKFHAGTFVAIVENRFDSSVRKLSIKRFGQFESRTLRRSVQDLQADGEPITRAGSRASASERALGSAGGRRASGLATVDPELGRHKLSIKTIPPVIRGAIRRPILIVSLIHTLLFVFIA